jgi:hypothetical protein
MSKQYLNNSQEQQSEQGTNQQSAQGDQNKSNSDQQAKVKEAAFVAEYESALGSFLGPKLYDAVSDQITLDKMTGYGNKLVEALLKLGIGELENVNPAINDKLQQQMVEGISKELEPIVAKLMQSETGMKLVEGLQNVVGSNPYGVAGVAVLAAAGAILADVDIPTIKQKFNLGKGFSTNLEANLGSLRNIAIGATKVGLAYQQNNLKADVSLARAKDGELSGSVGGQLGDNKRHIKGRVSIGEEGITAYELSGLYAFTENTSLSGKAHSKSPDSIPNMELQIKTKQGDFTHTGQLQFDSNSNNLVAKYSGQSEKFLYQASLDGNVDSRALGTLQASAQYTPQKGDVYSAKYRHNLDTDARQLNLLAQKRMGNFSLRGHQQLNYDDKDGLRSNTELMGAYHMNNDLSLIGGADVRYDDRSGETAFLPKAGIQYKDVPITLSFDPRTNATSVGITLKF